MVVDLPNINWRTMYMATSKYTTTSAKSSSQLSQYLNMYDFCTQIGKNNFNKKENSKFYKL